MPHIRNSGASDFAVGYESQHSEIVGSGFEAGHATHVDWLLAGTPWFTSTALGRLLLCTGVGSSRAPSEGV